MSNHARSSMLLFAGFVAGVAASSAVAVFAVAGHDPLAAHPGHYTVSIDEVRQNLVFGDFFTGRYMHAVKLSDGSVHQVTLTATSKNGQPMLELTDASGGKIERSDMGPFGTTTIGKLMVSVKDAGEMRAEMRRVTGR